jgi:hypothetical protein
MWIAPICAIVGVIVGAFLSQFLGAVRMHAEWVNEQKRLEYRQLIDQLFETVTNRGRTSS